MIFLKVTAEKGLKDRFFHGCWLGLALTSDNVVVSDEQGNVMIARSFRRLAEPLCRDVGLFNRIKGTPWHPIVREAAPRVLIDAPPVVPPALLPEPQSRVGEIHGPHRVHIRRNVELKSFGPTPGCPGCHAFLTGATAVGHSEACRERIENLMRQDAASKARVAGAELKRKASGSAAEPGVVARDGKPMEVEGTQ